jgi:predicted acylesterase/phospholipase RssA
MFLQLCFDQTIGCWQQRNARVYISGSGNWSAVGKHVGVAMQTSMHSTLAAENIRAGTQQSIVRIDEAFARSRVRTQEQGGGEMSKQYCDLIMKGGITSGVVYPKLISGLAEKYYFKNIGGASAGAIAAGACAAAEFARQNGKSDAFEELARLPETLGEKVTSEGRTRLFTLFQPAKSLRRHFSVLVSALNSSRDAGGVKIFEGVLRMNAALVLFATMVGGTLLWPFVRFVAPTALTGEVALLSGGCMLLAAFVVFKIFRCLLCGPRKAAFAWSALLYGGVGILLCLGTRGELSLHLFLAALGVILTSTLVLSLTLVVSILLFARGLLSGIHGNHYGICSGKSPDGVPSDRPALTDWLTSYFNGLAGLPPGSPPLTFGQLWGSSDHAADRRINLEVMTTAVSQQMVYSIPFREGTPSFYYDPDEWSELFPEDVMRHLDNAHRALQNNAEAQSLPEGARVQSASGTTLRPLPGRAELPVVVAVRMSLSFPVLLSAVPLYAIDWSCKRRQKEIKRLREAGSVEERAKLAPIKAKRVWFSDGGIGSNMPLHMFDALLPQHPTFAVNLKPTHPSFEIKEPESADNDGGRIYLPTNSGSGHLRYWKAPQDGASVQGLMGFLFGIVNTMQNWRDEIQFPYPGFRDRILQISQKPDEGGLNLDMPQERIAALSNAGCMAAQRLIDRFHPCGAERGKGWESHAESRLSTFLGVLQPAAAGLSPSLKRGEWAARLETITVYTEADREVARDFLAGVQRISNVAFDASRSLAAKAPKPLAQIRITPRI